MPLPAHPCRSWLFVPADDPRKIAKASKSGADVVILDLEDSVAADRKETARALVAESLSGLREPAVYIRVNDLTTGLTGQDVESTCGVRPDGYVLPKCEGPDDIERLAAMIRSHAADRQPGILAIATETVRGVCNLMRLDWSHPQLVGLTWGGEDLKAELGASRNRSQDGAYLSPFALARDLTLFAAKASGVLAIDSVYTNFRDGEGLAVEAGQAAAVGFEGKMAIHPDQIAEIHTQFTPDAEEIAWARKVIATLEAAGSGVASLDGQMLDRPHLRAAERLLRRVDPS
ncbi:HpcH/HpaI aldolase/citrate lyase family protein [Roseibium sp.]|uniref:HpcH/HpaI aldolase/citrate lyase family protein n=1 Tax=Roseibium sp. TaxID=1936156 RepID=UPI003A9770CB